MVEILQRRDSRLIQVDDLVVDAFEHEPIVIYDLVNIFRGHFGLAHDLWHVDHYDWPRSICYSAYYAARYCRSCQVRHGEFPE